MGARSLSALAILTLFNAVTATMASAQEEKKKDAKQKVLDFVIDTLKPKIGTDCIVRVDFPLENPDSTVTDVRKKKRDWDRAFCSKIRKSVDDELNLKPVDSLHINEKIKVGDTEFTLVAEIHPTAKAGAPGKRGDDGKPADIKKQNDKRVIGLAVGGNGGKGGDANTPNTEGAVGGKGGNVNVVVGDECVGIAIGGNAGLPGASSANASGQDGSTGGPTRMIPP